MRDFFRTSNEVPDDLVKKKQKPRTMICRNDVASPDKEIRVKIEEETARRKSPRLDFSRIRHEKADKQKKFYITEKLYTILKIKKNMTYYNCDTSVIKTLHIIQPCGQLRLAEEYFSE